MASADTIRRRALAAVSCAGVVVAVAGCGAKAAAERDGAGKISKAGAENLLKLRVGDCVSDMRKQLVDEPTSADNGVPTVNALPCSQSHDAEILLVAHVANGGWPGSEIVDGEAARGRETLRPRLSRLQDANRGKRLTLISFRPTQQRWEFEHQHQIVFAVLYAQPQRGAAAS